MARITSITNIEIMSMCDNACKYCPSPVLTKSDEFRKEKSMKWDTFKKAVEWVSHFASLGTQRECNLFGIGEPLLHPNIIDMVAYARNSIPERIILHMNTNGNKMTDEIAKKLKQAGITRMTITDHRAESTVKAARALRGANIPFGVSRDAVYKPNNWAGQVEWFEPEYNYPCQWIEEGQVMVYSDGRIATCCIDAFGSGIVGSVDDNLMEIDLRPHELCQKCHQGEAYARN